METLNCFHHLTACVPAKKLEADRTESGAMCTNVHSYFHLMSCQQLCEFVAVGCLSHSHEFSPMWCDVFGVGCAMCTSRIHNVWSPQQCAGMCDDLRDRCWEMFP